MRRAEIGDLFPETNCCDLDSRLASDRRAAIDRYIDERGVVVAVSGALRWWVAAAIVWVVLASVALAVAGVPGGV